MKNILLVTGIALCLQLSVENTLGKTTTTSVLEYATYIGGTDDDRAHDMTVDAQGNVYICAPIRSRDFPTTKKALQRQFTGVYAAKLNRDGESLLFSTFIGAPGGANYAHGIAVGRDGFVYLAGNTTNPGFPTTPGAFDRTYNGSPSRSHGDAFVVKLSPDGSDLAYATFIGGKGMDLAGKIAVDDRGYAYIVGCTGSDDFPITSNAYDTSFNGGEGGGRDDLFVAKLNPDGSKLVYCTYLGGRLTEPGADLIVDDEGRVTIFGNTSSPDFPMTANAYDGSYNGGSGHHGNGDGYVIRLSADGTQLDSATYIGGSDDDSVSSVALGPNGHIYVAGYTKSTDFPTTEDAWHQNHQGGQDGFLMVLSPTMDRVEYATLFGGSGNDNRTCIKTNDSGMLFLSGSTESSDFPTTENALDRSFNGASDLYVMLFDPATRQLTYSTLLGGSGYEQGRAQVWGNSLVLAGETTSRDFPTTANAYDRTYNGGDFRWGGDVFVTRLALDAVILGR